MLETEAPSQSAEDVLAARQHHECALVHTLNFIRDLGANVADQKSFTSATLCSHRRYFKKLVLRVGGVTHKIPVVLHYRDLGAHMSSTRRAVAPTLTARLAAVPEVCRAISALPIEAERRVQIIAMKVLPAALYGAQVAP
eukprot:14568099-Alexandrium_andersonii.AAC.1